MLNEWRRVPREKGKLSILVLFYQVQLNLDRNKENVIPV